jgi:hypothetical protein
LRMARPGLEPGTPRFSVVGRNLSNSVVIPANMRLLAVERHGLDVRKLHSFLLDLGTETRFGAQWRPINARGWESGRSRLELICPRLARRPTTTAARRAAVGGLEGRVPIRVEPLSGALSATASLDRDGVSRPAAQGGVPSVSRPSFGVRPRSHGAAVSSPAAARRHSRSALRCPS